MGLLEVSLGDTIAPVYAGRDQNADVKLARCMFPRQQLAGIFPTIPTGSAGDIYAACCITLLSHAPSTRDQAYVNTDASRIARGVGGPDLTDHTGDITSVQCGYEDVFTMLPQRTMGYRRTGIDSGICD